MTLTELKRMAKLEAIGPDYYFLKNPHVGLKKVYVLLEKAYGSHDVQRMVIEDCDEWIGRKLGEYEGEPDTAGERVGKRLVVRIADVLK